MEVTPAGISIDISDLQYWNANRPMDVNLLLSAKVTLTKAMVRPYSMPANAEEPMVVTLAGISIDVSEKQHSNAEEPMVVTLVGISIDVSE